MKKTIAAILALVCVLSVSGCNQQDNEYIAPSNFYYLSPPQKTGKMIDSEIREGAGFAENPKKIMNEYLSGPLDSRLRIPGAGKLCATSVFRNGKRMVIYMCDSFADLSSIEVSAAASCIALTIFDLSNVSEVSIYVKNSLLNGQKFILITKDGLELADEYRENIKD